MNDRYSYNGFEPYPASPLARPDQVTIEMTAERNEIANVRRVSASRIPAITGKLEAYAQKKPRVPVKKPPISGGSSVIAVQG